MGRRPILAASSSVLLLGVLLEESTPAVDSPTSTVVPPRSLSGNTTSCPLVDPRANQLVEEGPGSALTTTLTEFPACRCRDPGNGDRRFFFFVPFLYFAGGDYVSCLVLVLPNPPAPRSVSSRAATLRTWGVSILSRINWAIRSPTWTVKSSAE